MAKKSQEGDIESFSKLVEYFEKPLLRYIHRITNVQAETAEEILQESFIKAWKYINNYDQSFSFSTWIYRITHQVTISEYRKLQSRGEESKVEWNDEWMNNIEGTVDIEKEFASQQISEIVHTAISMLPLKYREAVILRFLEQKNYEEISDILEISVGSAGSLVSRGKSYLKGILQRNFNITE